MRIGKVERAAIKALSSAQRSAWEIMVSSATEADVAPISDVVGICRALQSRRPTFYLFTCLGTEKGREELKLDLRETGLFSGSRFKRAHTVLAKIREVLPTIQVKLILPDAEPHRVWGWDVSQEELTMACDLMIEQAEVDNLLPADWKAVTWTSLEDLAQVDGLNFPRALTWAADPARLQHVHAEAALMARHPYIMTRGEARDVGLSLTAHLAYESALLASLGPNGILLHVDREGARREKLLGGFRPPGIPVWHGISMR